MAIAHLMLGSNLGDRKENLEKCLSVIAFGAGEIIRFSSVYETEPWGFSHPVNFHNQLAVISTNLEPENLLKTLLLIEQSMGRQRNADDFEARIIDIDILFYGQKIIRGTNLTIPHPRIGKRRFILVPLSEIIPDMIHPVTMQTIWQMLRSCPDKLSVCRI